MGAIESRASSSPDVAATDAAEPPEPELPPPPPQLLAMPSELLGAVCAKCELAELSAMASICREMREAIPEHVWVASLARLMRAGASNAPCTDRTREPGRRFVSSVTRQAAIDVALEAAEAAAFSVAAEIVNASTSSTRLRVGRLRALVCNLCQAAPSGAMYLPTIQRGVCRACSIRNSGKADEWRYHQSAVEAAAISRRDAATGAQLHAALRCSLPPPYDDVVPRLVFSSDAMGGSVATLLRRAAGCRASLLVVTERDEGGASADARGAEEAAAAGASLAAAGSQLITTGASNVLSPLALRDIGRYAQRASAHLKVARCFGAFCPVPWPRTPSERKQAFGAQSSLLFSLSPRCKVFRAREGKGECFCCDGERGISIGGDTILPAVGLSPDLASARCLSSHTFGDTSGLASSTEVVPLGLVQLWDLTPPNDDEAAAGKAEIEKASVMNTRRDDAMMMQFRTSMMLRAE